MSTNKMAEVVDSEATPVDTFAPEARLDDNDRHKLIAFYKEKPNNSLANSQHPLLQNCPSKEESGGFLLSSADLTRRPSVCWRKC